MSKQTPMMQLIDCLQKDVNFLNGEDDCKEDRMVGQYLITIINDIKERYLPIEQQAFEDAFTAGQINIAKLFVEECNERNLFQENGKLTVPDNDGEDGKDYYNQTYKS